MKHKEKVKLVFLGPPGSGKGTFAKKLAESAHFVHIAAGDLLRKEVFKKSSLGKEIDKFLKEGVLVPNSIIENLIKNEIKTQISCGKNIVIDGFPRSLEQAKVLEKIMKNLGTKVDGVIYFKISLKEAIKRLEGRRNCPRCGAVYHQTNLPPRVADRCDLCGSKLIIRDDDQPETIKKRYEVYEKQTQPLIDYYSKKKNLHIVEAKKEINEILGKLKKIIKDLQNDNYKN